LREKAVDKVRTQYEIHPDLPPSNGSLEDCSAEELETLWIRNTVRIQYLRNRTLPPASGSLDLLSTTELQELWRRNAAVEQVQAEYRAANGAGTSRTTGRSEVRNEPLPRDAALAKVRRQYERNPELPLPRKPLESMTAADLEDLWIAHATLENVQGQFRMNPALPVPSKALHLFSTAELKNLWLRNDVRIQYLRNPKLPPPIRALELLSSSELLALQRKNVALEGSRSQLAAYRSTKGPSRR
jgi:hypothetical protein